MFKSILQQQMALLAGWNTLSAADSKASRLETCALRLVELHVLCLHQQHLHKPSRLMACQMRLHWLYLILPLALALLLPLPLALRKVLAPASGPAFAPAPLPLPFSTPTPTPTAAPAQPLALLLPLSHP